MPIRMDKDQNGPERRPENQPKPQPDRRRGSNFPLGTVLLGILAVIVKPKLLVPVLLILAGYFIFIHPSGNEGMDST
ncbi:MAG: hypothetical protein HKN68_14075, partial [Saprospiraceae bacterium]|nr:hypothetical protein [Saprospiraceae bacterium]